MPPQHLAVVATYDEYIHTRCVLTVDVPGDGRGLADDAAAPVAEIGPTGVPVIAVVGAEGDFTGRCACKDV